MKRKKLISLAVVVLMLCAAAITVNKAIFGYRIAATTNTVSSTVEETAAENDGAQVIYTDGLPGTIDGYAGPIPLEIYLEDGKITEVKPLPNAETPPFFKRASKVLSSWTGKTPAEALELKVDGVTGATYSSMAIIKNVNAGLAHYEGTKAKDNTSTPWKVWVALGVTLAACIIPVFVKNKWYHTVQLVANVLVLGFWCGQFLDYSLILKYISSGMTLPIGFIALAMLAAAFIYPLFGHPQYYCTHICPLGSAQQLTAEICHYKIHISTKVLKGLDLFRRILWAVLMLLLWADCLTGWMDLELFQAFQFNSASWWIIGAACLFIGLSAIVNRPYCRFVCPTGSLFKRAENIG